MSYPSEEKSPLFPLEAEKGAFSARSGWLEPRFCAGAVSREASVPGVGCCVGSACGVGIPSRAHSKREVTAIMQLAFVQRIRMNKITDRVKLGTKVLRRRS